MTKTLEIKVYEELIVKNDAPFVREKKVFPVFRITRPPILLRGKKNNNKSPPNKLNMKILEREDFFKCFYVSSLTI